MKKLVSIGLCATLLASEMETSKARANPVMGICIVAAVTLAATGIVVIIRSCRPKYYCLCDPSESPAKYWAAAASRREIIVNEWLVMKGPFASLAEAKPCPPPTNGVSAAKSSIIKNGNTGDSTLQYIHIEKSANLVDWVEQAVFVDFPDNMMWSQTNSFAEPTAYYRAWY